MNARRRPEMTNREACDLCDSLAEYDGLCEAHAWDAHLERQYDLDREAGLHWDNPAWRWVP